jgi:hypothetical protein
VGNIGLEVEPFRQCLQEEFADMYAALGEASIVATVGEDYLNVPDIQKGYDEIRVCTLLPISMSWHTDNHRLKIGCGRKHRSLTSCLTHRTTLASP